VSNRPLVSIAVAAALFVVSALCAAAAPFAPAAGAPRVARGHTLHIRLTTKTLAVVAAPR
jgi:hypothetical protein